MQDCPIDPSRLVPKRLTKVVREGQTEEEYVEHDNWDDANLEYQWTGETLFEIIDDSVPVQDSVSRPTMEVDSEPPSEEPTMKVQNEPMDDNSDLFDDSGQFLHQDRVQHDGPIPSSSGSSSSGLEDKWTKEGTRWM